VDLVSTDAVYLDSLLPIINGKFGEWQLTVNEAKTERTCISRTRDRISEEWRRTKKLGSLIGDAEDVLRRIQLAGVGFSRYWSMWLRGHLINEKLRIRLYNAFIVPILTYNMAAWGLTASQLGRLDSFHRKQLRNVIGVKYPQIVRNDDLYRRTSSVPLSELVKSARLRLLGHVLRSPIDTPAQLCMDAYFRCTDEKKFRGRPPSTLPCLLRNDLLPYNIPFKSSRDLQRLRERASDRQQWADLCRSILK